MLFKKKIIVLALCLVVVAALALCTQKKNNNSTAVKNYFSVELQQLQKMVQDSLLAEVRKGKDTDLMKTYFLNCRKQYKKIEFFAEYFYPTTARLVNGAPIAEIELGENMIDPPGGLQVIEGYLYGDLDSESKAALISEITGMEVALKRMDALNQEFEVTNAQIFDAIRLEIFRITALGISGFDTPLGLNVPAETAAALNGVKRVLGLYDEVPKALLQQVEQAIAYLKPLSFEKMNQLDFITNFLQPLNAAIANFRDQLKIETISSESILTGEASSLFQQNAFNINALLGNRSLYSTEQKIVLGKLLFSEVTLSTGLNRSCASCHHPEKAFTDGMTKAESLTKNKLLQRNTPTLTYAGFQNAFFYDLKATTLEDQAMNVVHNKEEMHGSLVEAAQRLNQSKKYEKYFKAAFPKDTAAATPFKIQNALASYVRSLAKFSSRFDLYMRGDKSQLLAEEKKGFNLFMGKAKCGACHFTPLFNGTAPPKFDHTEAEVLGVAHQPDTLNAKIDPDLGRYALNRYDQYRFAFKTPTLRNVAKTAPYMHNGAYQTLEQVMDFYNKGGGAGIGIHLTNQTLSADPLKLSKEEIKSIIAFLKTLDDQ